MDGAVTKRQERTAIRNHAAYWIARLHAENCTELEKQHFRQWLKARPDHAVEFEAMTDLWELGGGLGDGIPAHHAPPVATFPAQQKSVQTRRRMLATFAACAAATIPLSTSLHAARVLQTASGHFSDSILPGQVKCFLDTNTRLVCAHNNRYFRLEHGQVILCSQASVPAQWVAAGDVRLYLQDHSSAIIRAEENRIEVTALKGKVLVHNASLTGSFVSGQHLRLGERLSFYTNGTYHADRPDLEALLAWRKGYLMFQNRFLSEVVAEINRYQTQKVVFTAGSLKAIGNMRLSGIYYIGQGKDFFRILPHLLPIQLISHGSRIEILPS